MTDVLLATFALMPDGEPGGDSLLAALEQDGVRARWVCWDDADVDWAAAPLVAVRATWDYQRRLPEFLAWARRVEAATTLLNGAEVFAWNADKSYLRELAAAGLPVVPTTTLDDAGLVEGELSLYVVDGEVVAQVDKLPAVGSGEIRVHEQYGGRSRPGVATRESAELARRAVRVAELLRGADLAYARVDLMRWQGDLVVSELELIEPGLYLDVLPGIATPFAAMVRRRLEVVLEGARPA